MSNTRKIEFEEADAAHYVYGQRDAFLRLIEKALDIEIGARGNEVTLTGDDESLDTAEIVLQQLYNLARKGFSLSAADVSRAVNILEREPETDLAEIFLDSVFVSVKNRHISPKGINQKRYVDAIRRNDIVFGVGPAGTGKTFLAMAMALSALLDKQVKRIILTRPAVEAGENLGFLPGDLEEKVNPYLRPLHDAIFDMVERDRAESLMERGDIEVAPLAFMRGRTLNDAFVVLDEAQNATTEQMKMFLTRLGFNSKAVITGDVTQIDLPRHQKSGLVQAISILGGIRGISVSRFTEIDVVRHPLVQKIIVAYDRASKEA